MLFWGGRPPSASRGARPTLPPIMALRFCPVAAVAHRAPAPAAVPAGIVEKPAAALPRPRILPPGTGHPRSAARPPRARPAPGCGQAGGFPGPAPSKSIRPWLDRRPGQRPRQRPVEDVQVGLIGRCLRNVGGEDVIDGLPERNGFLQSACGRFGLPRCASGISTASSALISRIRSPIPPGLQKSAGAPPEGRWRATRPCWRSRGTEGLRPVSVVSQ